MNIELMANEKGEVCLVHDARFPSDPEWVEYDATSKKMTVVLQDGTMHDIGFSVDDKIAALLKDGAKTLLVLVDIEKKDIVEGYEVSLNVRK